ncbi:MAG: phospholipid-binding protein MlaC [Desulfovibrionales bacterium]
MKRRIPFVTSVVLALFLVTSMNCPPVFGAESPTEALKAQADSVLAVLKSEKYEQASAEQRMDMLLAVSEDFFNKEEIAKRTLAVHWKRFSEEQREEFIDLFTEFLKQNYFGKLQDFEYENEEVLYLAEDLADSRARVKTMIVTADKEIPVNYSLIQKNGQWQIYDARIEGVSMVQNYRSQFNGILNKNDPEYLLDLLRKKLEQPAEG